MTLKEKFKDALNYQFIFGTYQSDKIERASENSELIADQYVVKVLEWLTNEKSKFSIMYGNQEKRFSTIEEDYTAKELLELFKKEKGL